MGYKNPTLAEIFVEIPLLPNNFGPNEYFKVVPLLNEQGLGNVEVLPFIDVNKLTQEGKEKRVAAEPSSIVRCWSDKKEKLVQLANNLVIVNQVGAYLGWKQFLELLKMAENAVGENFIPHSIALNTIDKLELPAADFKMGKYFNCNGSFLPRWYSENSEDCDVNLGKGLVQKHGSNRQLTFAVKVQEAVVQATVRSKFHNILDDPKKFHTVLEELHNESNNCFEDWITDKTRSLMGEEK